jgi:DNA-binding XRE family transcriptional regulator
MKEGGDEMDQIVRDMILYRARNDISMKEFAKRCGISYFTIAAAERGETNLSRKSRAKIRLIIGGKDK